MTKLKVVAILAVLLASQSAFARGGGGGMSHGDHMASGPHEHMTVTHTDHATMSHGLGHRPVSAHHAAEFRRIRVRIQIISAQLFKLITLGQQNSLKYKVLTRERAMLQARLRRLAFLPSQGV